MVGDEGRKAVEGPYDMNANEYELALTADFLYRSTMRWGAVHGAVR